MPSESVWLQYSVVAIVILAMVVIWREMRNFINEQDAHRDSEREKQRLWQAEQDTIRDKRWHEFLKSLQAEYIAQDGRQTEAINELETVIAALLKKFEDHDRFVRESVVSMRERTSKT